MDDKDLPVSCDQVNVPKSTYFGNTAAYFQRFRAPQIISTQSQNGIADFEVYTFL